MSTIAYYRLLCSSAGQRDFGSLLLLLLQTTYIVHSTTKDALVWLEHPIEQAHLWMMAAAKFQRHGIFTKMSQKAQNVKYCWEYLA